MAQPQTLNVSPVNTMRVPDQGIQPRAVTDGEDNVHLLYFKLNEPAENKLGHLYYQTLDASSQQWHTAQRVTTQAYPHNDQIGKASIAVDDQGRVHIAWVDLASTQFFYSRSNPERTLFEPPRSLVSEHLEGIEAEPALAVRDGHVAISWHAGPMLNEATRTVYSISSHDHGATFGEEQQIGDSLLGACACCGLTAAIDPTDQLLVAYRTAVDNSGRHMQLLHTGATPMTKELDPWQLNACPVTSNQMLMTGNDYQLVFETRGRILLYQSRGNQLTSTRPASNGMRQKHPSLAVNSRGDYLLAWGEGRGYRSGGHLNWQRLHADGTAFRGKSLLEGESWLEGESLSSSQKTASDAAALNIPDYSIVTAVARADNTFLLIY
jgi:hypothetical protein